MSRNIIIPVVVAGAVLFAAAPAAVNATLSQAGADVQPVAHIVTSSSTHASAGIGVGH